MSWEDDEWRDAVRRSTPADLELAEDSHRAALGLVGDQDDARGEW